MVLNAASLNRRIQVQRFNQTGRDGFGSVVGEWVDEGPLIFARRRDVSDAERLVAARWESKLVTRFVIRATASGRSVRRTDRIVHEGVTYGIDGIKEVPGSLGFLEITALTSEVP